MTDFHELFDESAPDHDLIGDALRRELRETAVPYDPQRADDMIAAATAADPRRLSRLAAPLATAAAVLAVAAGVAVFATTGGSDSAMPGGGGPKPTPTATSAIDPAWGGVECPYSQRRGSAVPSLPPVPTVAPRQEQTVTCSNDVSMTPTPMFSCAHAGVSRVRAPLPRRLSSYAPARPSCGFVTTGMAVPPPATPSTPSAASRS